MHVFSTTCSVSWLLRLLDELPGRRQELLHLVHEPLVVGTLGLTPDLIQ